MFAALLLGSSSSHAATLIDFENLPDGEAVLEQYRSLGIEFNGPRLVDYSVAPARPGFASSGTKAIELCYGVEFCRVPLDVDFQTDQSRVAVAVGYTAALSAPRTVILRAFDLAGAEIGHATALLGPSGGPIPIRAMLEVSAGSPHITRATVGFLDAEDPGPTGSNDGLAIDDLSFEAAPCPSSQPPALTVSSPAEGTVLEGNAFTFSGSVATVDPTVTLEFWIDRMDGTRATVGPTLISSGNVSRVVADQLLEGRNVVTVSVRDCFGSTQVTRTLFFRPRVHVEVTQVIQDLENSVPLFVGKRTLARAYVNTASPTVLTAAIYTANDLTTPVWGPITVGPTAIPAEIQRSDLRHTLNFEIPLGPYSPAPWLSRWVPGREYVLRTTVHEPLASPISTDTRLVFYASVPLALKPIWCIEPDGSRVARETFAAVLKRVNVLYPTSRIIVHDDNTTTPVANASWVGVYGLFSRLHIQRWLDSLAIQEGLAPPGCSSCYWTALRATPLGPGQWGLADAAPGEMSVVYLTPDDFSDSYWAQAQEVAHNLGRLHASSDHGEVYPDPFFPYPHGGITDLETHRYWSNVTSLGRENGVDPGTAPDQDQWWCIPSFVGDPSDHNHDYMSYGKGPWTSKYTYDALGCGNAHGSFDSWYSAATDFPPGTLYPIDCVGPSLTSREPAVTTKVAATGRDAVAPVRTVVVGGTIRSGGGVVFGPAYILNEQVPPRGSGAGSGGFSVRLLSATNEVLGKKSFERSGHSHDDDDVGFGVSLPWDDRTAYIAVVNDAEGGVEWGRVSRRVGQPTAAFEAVPASTLDKPKEVRWRLSHPDHGGGMASTLAFSPDGGRSWTVLAENLTKTSYLLNPASLPGAVQGQLRLIVSDGIQTTFVDSRANIKIAPKPPIVSIIDPTDRARIGPGARLFLRAYATSPQKGVLGDAAFSWFAEGQLLAQGPEVEIRGLTAGPHLIRVEVLDPDGLKADDEVTVILDPASIPVLGDSPGTTLPSIAPVRDATRPEITVRLAPRVLWPPNHKMRDITATVTVTDPSDPSPRFVLASITSSEPGHYGSNNTNDDILDAAVGSPDVDFQLRSERRGKAGRFYVACYRASNSSGNTAMACDTVYVPHDRDAGAVLTEAAAGFSLAIFGGAGAEVRRIVPRTVEVGSDHPSVSADRTAPSYADVNGDGVEDVTFSFVTSSASLREWIASGAELYARWADDAGSFLAPVVQAIAAAPTAERNGGLRVAVFPNPVQRDGVIRYSLPAAGHVRLAVYDLAGREIACLVNGRASAGDHEVRWSGSNRMGGPQVYYYRLTACGQSKIGRFVHLR